MRQEESNIFADGKIYRQMVLVQYRINTDDANPIRELPRRLLFPTQEESTRILKEIFQNDVIDDSMIITKKTYLPNYVSTE